ncbi:fatty acyl-CoA reductase wat-like [Vespa crabro]|uniref:fatty acyl-CoA reductase wat-like n=1 Tax=Vespa crabro TaxID=7445 RepID=UPI001F022ECA|nr:fatty acyl-CoA reductase wat-like [Vespa crabro]XP_046837376.1 fatty acyl-CoA reductase wat-like [Vespa crabro]
MYNKIHKMSDNLCYFSTTEWNLTNERWDELTKNLKSADDELFFCNMKKLDWDSYFQTYILGIRTYILKDSIDTLPQAHIKWQRLYWMHRILKFVIVYFFLMVTWAMVPDHF